jgi:hypothetical protein
MAIAVIFAVLTVLSWRRWGDVQIDSGRELYIAWALASGQTLYLDIFERNGPLPYYVNALWFKLFGASITVLAVSNLAILAVFLVLVYRTCLRLTDRLTATLCGATALVVSGIAQEAQIGNYNFVLPYNHHQTHGIVLGAFGVAALERWLETGRARFAAVAGLCLGLVFLTKAELFMPIAVTAAAAWAVAVFGEEGPVRPRPAVLPFLLGAAAPPLAFVAGLSTRMPLGVAWWGILGSFRHLADSATLHSPFYRTVMGLDRPLENFTAILHTTLVLSIALVVAIGIDRLVPRRRDVPRSVGLTAGTLTFVLLIGLVPVVAFFRAASALPLTCAAAVIGGTWRWYRGSVNAEARHGVIALVLWALYAGLLLAKLGLYPRFSQYGFALALVATVLAVALLVGWVPHRLKRRDGYGGDLFCSLATGGVLALLFVLALRSRALWARRTLSVGEGPDAILVEMVPADDRGWIMARGLERLREVVPPGGTLAVLPEGAFINYWLRSPNPTPYLTVMPPDMEAEGGEVAVTARFQATPPDVLVLIYRDSVEYGMDLFGRDPRWGKLLIDWVRSAYEPIETIGGDPLASRSFGLTIFRRIGATGGEIPPSPHGG